MIRGIQEGDKTHNLNMRISPRDLGRLRKQAKVHKVSVADIVRYSIGLVEREGAAHR